MADNTDEAKPQPEKKKEAPDFQWIEVYPLGPNSPEITPAIKTQKRILNELLPRRKNPYSLSEWYLQNRNNENDDLLYSLCGVIHPSENEMLHYYISRWRQELIKEKQAEFSPDEEEYSSSVRSFSVPRATLDNFLKDHERAEFMLEHHRNLLLRISAVRENVNQIARALHIDSMSQNRSQWVSAMDELIGQYEFDGQATVPSNEYECWIWMNKMIAPTKHVLWKMNFSSARKTMQYLNSFRIHRGFVSLWDFSDSPSCPQRSVEEKAQQKTIIPWMAAKILTSIGFLLQNGFLDTETFSALTQMSPQERLDKELLLERQAVSAFLGDMSKAAPDSETLTTFMKGFYHYFSPILQKVGCPTLQEVLYAHKNQKGEVKLEGLINVSFQDKKAKSSGEIPHRPLSRSDSGLSK